MTTRLLLRGTRTACVRLVLAFSLVLGAATPASWAAATGSVTVTKAIQGGLTTVDAGVEFTYLINYAYASTTTDGQNVTLVDFLDADLSWTTAQVIPGTTIHIASTAYDQATGKVTWNFVNPLPAGSSGQLTLRVRFPLGTTLPGTVAANTATMDGDNTDPKTSNEVSISATATCKWVANVTGPTSAAIGQNVTYRARLDRPNPATGNLNTTSGNLALTLPVGVLPADVVNANGGTLTGTGTAGDPVIVTWATGVVSANGANNSEAFGRDLVIKYDAARFNNGQVVTVSEAMSVTVLGGGTCGGTDTQNTTLTTFTATPNATVSKGSSDTTVILSTGSFSYYLDANGTGNVGLDDFTVSDVLPANFELVSLRTPTVANGPGGSFIYVRYRTTQDLDSAPLRNWGTGGGPYAVGTTLPVSDLGLPAGHYVRYVQVEFGDVASNFALNNNANAIRLTGRLISPGWDGTTTVTTGDTVCNTMTLSANYNGSAAFTPKTAEGCVTVILPTVRPTVAKSVISGNPTIPGGTTTWQVELSNPSSSDIPMVNPKGMDLLPASLEYVAGSLVQRTDGTFNSSGAPAPTLEAIDNYNGTGRTLLRWSYAHSFPINTRATVQFQTRVKAGTSPGNINNRGYVSVDPAAQAGPVVYATSEADANDLDGDGSTTDLRGRTGDVATVVGSTASLDSFKLVKGQLDSDWHRYPESGLTSPGGTADYRLVVKNTGNVSLKSISITDILPIIGDTGVVTPEARNTQWTPFLTGPVSAPSGVTVYYSTESNPQRDDMGDPDPFPTGSNPPNWSAVPPGDITTVRSLRIDFGTTVLAGGDQLELSWPMRAPVNAPTGGEIAWNSFGVVATRDDNNSILLPTEPIKVGIAVEPIKPAAYGNLVWQDLDRDGVQDLSEPGLDGVRVELYRDNGDGLADPATDSLVGFTLTSGGGQYLFSFLPAGDYYAVFYRPPTYAVSPQDTGTVPTPDENDSDGGVGTYNGFEVTIAPVTTLISGELDLTWDQGFYQPTSALAAVGDYVWFDEDNDGLQNEPGANGLNGVVVTLYDNGGNPVGTRTTANDVNGNPGYYLFDSLTPGTYSLGFTLPNGFTFTTRGPTGSRDPADSDPDTSTGRTETFTLAGGQYDPSWDAGMRLPTGNLSLGDRVWKDTNGNGLYEPGSGELGVDGVKLNLYRDLNGNGGFDAGVDQYFGTTTTFTKTGVPGYYLFDNLPAGDFIVQVDPVNFTSGEPLFDWVSSVGNGVAPDPDNNLNDDDNGEPMTGQGVVSRAITLSVGDEPTNDGDADANSNLSLDFGFYQPNTLVALGNFVFLDADANGRFDVGEAAVPQVTVELWRDVDGDGVFEPAGDDLQTPRSTTTDPSGRYVFDLLPPGRYFAHIPAAEFQVGGDLAGRVSTPGAGGDTGQDQTVDENGVDSATPGTTGITSSVIVLAVDAEPTTGDDDTGYTGPLDDNNVDLTVDFGFANANNYVALGNVVFEDLNANGKLDGAETRRANVTVELWADDGDGVFEPAAGDTLVDTRTTDASGRYVFDLLAPGSYFAHIPAGEFQSGGDLAGYLSSPGAGGDNGQDQSVDENGIDSATPATAGITSSVIALAVDAEPTTGDDDTGYTGQLDDNNTDLTVDFGVFRAAAIGDKVWVDADGDGVQDPAEGGLGGVTVRLYRPGYGPDGEPGTGDDADPVGSATTSPTGGYQFTGLVPGDYQVEVVLPAGYGFTHQDRGGDDTVDSDVEVATGLMEVTTLSPGENDVSWDAGVLPYGALTAVGNRVFLDANQNGRTDTGELGIPNVGVELWLDADGDRVFEPYGDDGSVPVRVTQTDPDGRYFFDLLPAGRYFVHVPAPEFQLNGDLAGYISSTGNGLDTGIDETADENGVDDVDPPSNGITSVAVDLAAGVETVDDLDTGYAGPLSDDATDFTIDFGFIPESPTLALVQAVNGHVTADGGVVIEVQTAAEVGAVGFDLYREAGGQWVRVNEALILAANRVEGSSYRIPDPGAVSGHPVMYLWVETEDSGVTRYYGPFEVSEWTPLPTRVSPPEKPAVAARALRQRSVNASSEGGEREGRTRMGGDSAGTPARLRFTTTAAGLHQLPAADLARVLGLPEDEIRAAFLAGGYRLSNRGQPVGVVPAVDGGALYFRATAVESAYTARNVYWVESGPAEPAEILDGRAPEPVSDTWYMATMESWMNYQFVNTLDVGPEGDAWIMSRLRAGNQQRYTVRLDHLAVESGRGADISVRLLGASAGRHRVTISLNDSVLGTAEWSGKRTREVTVTAPAPLLLAGNNRLAVRLEAGDDTAQVCVDGYRVVYPRRYVASSTGLLEFGADDNPVVTVGGFTHAGVAVLEIGDPRRLAVVQNLTVTAGETSHSVSFTPDRSQGLYVAFQPEGLPAVTELTGVAETSYGDARSRANRANYVIITPASLLPAAQELAAYRRADKLAVVVAVLEDLYNEFNHGLASPHAVKAFLRATQDWQVRPQYAVLLGNGTYDYRDLGRHGDNLMPPLMVATRYGLFTSDSVYGDTNDDGRPEIVVGRLPGLTVEELLVQVAKIQAFEARPVVLPKQALFLADRPDQAGDFAGDTEFLASLLGSGTAGTVVQGGEGTLNDTRARVRELLAGGVDFFNYVGHGGLKRLGSAGYLTTDDLALLPVGVRPPVMFAMSCVVGQYSTPGVECLAESMVGAAESGAIAFWGPTGLSSNSDARLMNQRLMRVLGKTTKNTRLGAILNQAVDGYLRVDRRAMSPWIYNLLGDPALRLDFRP